MVFYFSGGMAGFQIMAQHVSADLGKRLLAHICLTTNALVKQCLLESDVCALSLHRFWINDLATCSSVLWTVG
jgi:hypothetical protein